MTRFSRRARWLQELFQPSTVPAKPSFPDRYSSDVSLTSPYDGGGWGLENPEVWIRSATSSAAAATTTTIVTVGGMNIFRLVAASAQLIAGAVPTFAILVIEDGAAAVDVAISPHVTLVSGQQHSISVRCPIIGPTHIIRGKVEGGDVATVVLWRLYGVELPLGMSPTI